MIPSWNATIFPEVATAQSSSTFVSPFPTVSTSPTNPYAVPLIREKTHLPVIVDPSHATGKANLVEPMMIAAVAAGADGLEVEVHYDPRHAWSDGAQCLTPDAFAQAMAKCRQVAWAIGRDM